MATGPQIRGNGGDHRVGLAVDGRVNRPVGITGVRRQRPHRAGSGRRDGHPRAHNRHKGRMLTAGARPGKPERARNGEMGHKTIGMSVIKVSSGKFIIPSPSSAVI